MTIPAVFLLLVQIANAPQAAPHYLTGQLTYPELAQRARKEGNITVEVTTNREGRVAQFAPISAHPLFIHVAERESSTWRFSGEGKCTVFVSYRIIHQGTKPLHEAVIAEARNRLTVLAVFPEYLPLDGRQLRYCPRHRCSLIRALVPIRYGLIATPNHPIDLRQIGKRFLTFLRLSEPEDYFEAEKRLFPFAASVYYGGCILQEYPKAEVFFCPQCRDREQRWKKDH